MVTTKAELSGLKPSEVLFLKGSLSRKKTRSIFRPEQGEKWENCGFAQDHVTMWGRNQAARNSGYLPVRIGDYGLGARSIVNVDSPGG